MTRQPTTPSEPVRNAAAAAAGDQKQDWRIRLPSLGLRISERRLLLAIMDTALLNGSLMTALILWSDFIVSGPNLRWAWRWFVTLTAVWFACSLFFDCYNLARSASTTDSLRNTLLATTGTLLIYTLTPYLTPPLESRGFIFIFGGLAIIALTSWRLAYAKLFVQPWFGRRALVVGAGAAGQRLAQVLREAEGEPNPFRGTGYELVGFVDDDPQLADGTLEGVPVLGRGTDLVSLLDALQVDEIVLAITHRHSISAHLFDALLHCQEHGTPITTMALLYERLLGRVPIEHVGRDLHLVLPMQDTASGRLYLAAKRMGDLVIALVGVAPVALLIPIAALINAVSSPGPLFYRQTRVGLGGRRFEMLKFRTMVPEAEATGSPVWASSSDPRVTPLGRALRPMRIDELPQLINILRGEMSLIGPRPERPEFATELAETLPFYRARHVVRPGITGWAQVRFGYGNSVEHAKIKLEHDLYYVKNAGLLLDLRILLRTIPVMLSFQG